MQARKQAEDEDHRIPTSKTRHGMGIEHAGQETLGSTKGGSSSDSTEFDCGKSCEEGHSLEQVTGQMSVERWLCTTSGGGSAAQYASEFQLQAADGGRGLPFSPARGLPRGSGWASVGNRKLD